MGRTGLVTKLTLDEIVEYARERAIELHALDVEYSRVKVPHAQKKYTEACARYRALINCEYPGNYALHESKAQALENMEKEIREHRWINGRASEARDFYYKLVGNYPEDENNDER